MIFALTDEQEMLRAAVRGALERSAPPNAVREWLEAGDGRPATMLAIQQCWIGIGVPDAINGGQGGGLVELALAVEEHARASVPGALLSHTGLAVAAARAACEDGDPFLHELLAGDRLAALTVDADAPLGAPAVAAAPTADGVRLNGVVTHVLGAGEASDFGNELQKLAWSHIAIGRRPFGQIAEHALCSLWGSLDINPANAYAPRGGREIVCPARNDRVLINRQERGPTGRASAVASIGTFRAILDGRMGRLAGPRWPVGAGGLGLSPDSDRAQTNRLKNHREPKRRRIDPIGVISWQGRRPV